MKQLINRRLSLFLAVVMACAPIAHAAQQTINRGTTAGDGTGESLYSAFGKVNANDAELYSLLSTKAPLVSPTFTGAATFSGTITGSGVATLLSPYLTSAAASSTYMPLSGGTFTGAVTGSSVSVGASGTLPANNSAGVMTTSSLLVSSTHVAGSPDAYVAWFGNNYGAGIYDLVADNSVPSIHAVSIVPSVRVTSNVPALNTQYIHSIWGDDGSNRVATQASSLWIQQPTVNGTFTGTTGYGILINSVDPGGKFGSVWGLYTSDAIFGQALWTQQGEIYFGGNGSSNARIKQNTTTLSMQRGDGAAYASVETGALSVKTGGINITGGAVVAGGMSLTNNSLTITAGSLIQSTGNAPATSSSTCSAGQHAWDSSYIYICVAANSWRRAALSTF